MKTNFDINIPSIPSKIIKFKIQDIKSTAFGSQRGRFNQNKGFLTKKFIESFNNFKEKSVKEHIETETQAESQVSFKPERTELQYRFLIPEEKKYMLHHYEKYKNYEAPPLKETKYDRGYSFYKTQNMARAKEDKQSSQSIDDGSLTDNFYFPARKDKERVVSVEQKKHTQPSCIFKNQTRKRVYSKMEKTANAIPGPGTYLFPLPQKQQKPIAKHEENQPEFDYKNLKKIITNIITVQNQQVGGKEEENDDKEEKKVNYMFMEDDRDRFGNQKYPIAQRVNVPGPGAYEMKDSLQDHAKKIVLVEEQRKLLKEWFNN